MTIRDVIRQFLPGKFVPFPEENSDLRDKKTPYAVFFRTLQEFAGEGFAQLDHSIDTELSLEYPFEHHCQARLLS
jgi:hypothetical protein